MKKAGDSGAPRELLAAAYDRHAGVFYRYAVLITANRSVAEDAVQQAFAKLAAMGGRIAELASVENYLRTAVRNECYHLLQSRHTGIDGTAEAAAILEPVDAALGNEDQRRVIEAALRTLPPEQREIIHLKVYEGMTFQRIADLLKISLNTAASRYRYAMDKLRPMLECLERDQVQ